MDTKSLRVEVKDASQGRIKAVFSTLGVVDSDGDVTLPGAFTDGAPVRISAYGHASWQGALPVGKGVIHADGQQATLDGEFFMNTTHGRDTFETVKQLGDLGEWSYGFDVLEAEPGTKDGQSVQYLKRLAVHEVSPVLLGAGVNTRTVDAKGRKADQPAGSMDDGSFPIANRGDLENAIRAVGRARPNTDERRNEVRRHIIARARALGLTELIPDAWNSDGTLKALETEGNAGAKASLNDELAHAMDVVGRVIESAERVAALRAEKGKALSGVNAEILAGIDADLTRLRTLLGGDVKSAANHDTDHGDVTREYLRSVARNL